MVKALLAAATLAALVSAVPSPQAADSRPPCSQDYDYIIVGGGTAGNAVAARLSLGLPSSRILVVEAGPAAPDELGINVPGRKGSTLGTKYDWNFTTVPQPGLNGRVVGVNRGRVLGGSSALNLLVYDKASTPEYDAWEDVGNPGWNWASMRQAMVKSENYTGGPPGSGTRGPVHAVVNRVIPAHQRPWIPTVHDTFGIPTNDDSLGGNPIGVMYQPSSIDPTHYNRSYSANAYLPIAGSNLRVLTDTTVAKINLKKAGQKYHAGGITLANGTVIAARREVILSAGTIQSPGLLELSGVGQASVLAAAKIPQLMDLPGVGENYQDHIRIQTSYQLKDNYTSFDILRYNTTFAAQELAKWVAGQVSLYDYTGSGFIFANWAQVFGKARAWQLRLLAQDAVGNSTHPADEKKLEYYSNPAVPQLEVIFSDGYTGVRGYPAQGTPLYGKGFFTIIAGLMHPLSRGSVHLTATDPHGKPTIDPHYLNSEHDVAALVEAAKFCRAIAQADGLRSEWVSEYEPGLDVVRTDAQWRAYVLNNTLSIFHPTSTCAMLPREDGGVVGPDLRVHGIDNLRVADASVIPIQISAHIQTAVYGIAERAAEMIIKDARSYATANGAAC